MVKPEKIETKIKKIQEYLDYLSFLAKMSKKEFLSDFRNIESAKHLLQVTIECCLDIANHIIASEQYRNPSDYADSFKILYENKIIPDDLIKDLLEMARFRNRIVHIYWEVDNELIYSLINQHLCDFDRYARAILDLIT